MSLVFASLSICSGIGFLVLFYWWHSKLASTKLCNRLPTFKFIPLWSYWSLFARAYIYEPLPPLVSILQFLCAVCKLYEFERIVLIWLSFRPIVFFFKPETVEAVLNNPATNEKSSEYNFLKSWLSTGLLTSSGEKWRSRRKLLTPTFHFRILADFLTIFNEQSEILTRKMESLVGSSSIDITSLIKMCTLDIICETAMGVRINAQSGQYLEYVKAISHTSDIFILRLFRPWLWNDFIFFNFFPSGWRYKKSLKLLHQFTRTVIKEKKDYLKKNSTIISTDKTGNLRKKAFLELLLEHHLEDEMLTEEDIREEVDTFMFEGHDTTAIGISWTLYNLGLYPDIQEKVFEELDTIFQGDNERAITSEDLKNMKYTECVLKESLRLYPSVPFIARKIHENIQVLDYTIPPGVTCFIMIMMLHRDPKQFPNPEKFDPNRFLPENATGRHPFAYVPFSAGPRNCIGQRFAFMEEKTILAHILRKFQLISSEPMDKIHTMAGIILRNYQPLEMRLIPRSKCL
ncbi:cytochrome P450 4V2-like [Stegodyphus dumicola]|uniref:cytochrome P450 4V2-like n=1 Tax=Stegodyphus dumicola TaxID=202533 RepID=UPI0015B07926|nr:cytochrome P450 4V2-like [Stegodyphus dumicola]